MARLATYSQDTSISVDDLLIGTDAEDSNITKNYKIGDLKDFIAGSELVTTKVTLTSAELLSFSTYPTKITLIEAPGPNKAIVALNAAFKLDFTTGPIYNFNQDLRFAYIDPTGTVFAGNIPLELLNAGPGDQYATEDLPGQPGSPYNPIKVNSSFGIANNPGTNVTQGTGTLTIDLLYRIVNFS